MVIINLYDKYYNYFSAELKAIFERCSKIAFKQKVKIYLIGGPVRDLLLDRKNHDVDITVEGDVIEFVKILEKKIGAEILSVHQNFGTAKIEIQGEKIDFASTRSEIYPKKGHLPKLEQVGCTLKEDISRRDFTVNSLALSLNQENFADLTDYTGGIPDLKNKKIRVLHDKSFIDDPSRIIRGLKYCSRLDFELEKHTFDLQKKYLQNVNYDMCGKRIKNELKLTFNDNSQKAFEKFIEQGIYKLITKKNFTVCKNGKKFYAELSPAPYRQILLDRFRNKSGITIFMGELEKLIRKYKIKNPWIIYLGFIGVFEKNDFFSKLELTKKEKEMILIAKNLLKTKIKKDDFDIYKTFFGKSTESLLIYYFITQDNKVLRYLDVLRGIKIKIKGSDLIKMGLKPSEKFSEIFDYVLKAKIKNPKISKAKEIELVGKFCNH